MNKKRIAQVAPLWIPIPPRTYGGTELMVYNVSEELYRRGHELTLFASGDSRVSMNLISIVKSGIWLKPGFKNPHAPIIRLIKILSRRFRDFDLIHNHFDFFMFPLSSMDGCPPMLTTLHRPIDGQYAETLSAYRNVHLCAISQDQKKSIEEFGLSVDGIVPNGIDIKRYDFNEQPGDYFLYLGRLNKEKGIVTALKLAKKAKKKLVVSGNVVGGDEWLFFMKEVQPLLSDENVNFRGESTFEQKVELIKNAKAMLFPIDRREPFGLVMIESMACGTPVIAYRCGSVPEVVHHGKNGFVCADEEEMLKFMQKIDQIDRRACRRFIEENFTTEKMVNAYEAIYEKILNER